MSGLTALPATLIVSGTFSEGQFHARAIDLPAIGHRIEAYRAQHGALPADETMIAPYRFERHDGGVKVLTLGSDGHVGGEGPRADQEHWILTCESASAPATCLRLELPRSAPAPRGSRCSAPTSPAPGSR